MKGRKHSFLRLLLVAVVLFLAVVWILYDNIHRNHTKRHFISQQYAAQTYSTYHTHDYDMSNDYTPQRHLSIGIVKTSSNLPLFSVPKTSVTTNAQPQAYVPSGTLLLLDASNSISYHGIISIQVVFPYKLWLIVSFQEFGAQIQFLSVSASIQCNIFQDYDLSCMENSFNRSRYCSMNSTDDPLVSLLQSPYYPLLDYEERNYSPYQFDVEVSHADWTQQISLANGKMGALLGGNHFYEVIPLSMENLFAYRFDNPLPRNNGNNKRNIKSNFISSTNVDNNEADSTPLSSCFLEAREQLYRGNIRNATVLMSKLRQGKASGGDGIRLGMFQGAGDIVIVMGKKRIEKESNDSSSNSNVQDLQHVVPITPNVGLKRMRGNLGDARLVNMRIKNLQRRMRPLTRRGVVEDLYHTADFSIPPFQEEAFNRLSLDMLHGTASQQILYESEKEKEEGHNSSSPLSWVFKSAYMDKQALVYHYHCIEIEGSASSPLINLTSLSSSCLSAGVTLRREGAVLEGEGGSAGGAGGPKVAHELGGRGSLSSHPLSLKQVESLLEGGEEYIGWKGESAAGYEILMQVGGTETLSLPSFALSLKVLCWGGEGEIEVKGKGKGGEGEVVVCSNVQHLLLILSSVKEESLGKDPAPSPSSFSTSPSTAHVLSLLSQQTSCPCFLWRNYLSHRLYYSQTMRSVYLSPFSPTDQLNTSLSNFLSLSPTLFQFSRYFLFISGSSSPINLQGLVADGLTSVWNGDYHLNINMQMIYGGIGRVGLGGLLTPPLRDFVQKLKEKGQECAQELYGLEGWVAHGFTDSSLRGGIGGDLQWALCPTCGVWLALHLFEAVIFYSNPTDEEVEELREVLKGAVKFFTGYLLAGGQEEKGKGGEKRVLTGPSSSPENSYLVKNNGDKIGKAEFLSLSPAIDISILSQLSTSFNILLRWIEVEGSSSLQANVPSDKVLATELQDLLTLLPHHGLPVGGEEGVMEYPLLSSLEHWGEVDENLDPGHRHLSLLHWLHPSPFPPPLSDTERERLFVKVKESLLKKRRAGGGQTAWSAAWLSSLFAKLALPEAWEVLEEGAKRFFTANLLSLHPPLRPTEMEGGECATCFREDMGYKSAHSHVNVNKQNGLIRLTTSKVEGKNAIRMRGAVEKKGVESLPQHRTRGLVTDDDAKFQLDGNVGFSTALLDLLIQSPYPGEISLLPTLHSSPSQSGALYGVQATGGARISMSWTDREIDFVHLQLSNHFLFRTDLAPANVSLSSVYTLQSRRSSDVLFQLSILTPSRLKSISFMSAEQSLCGSVNLMEVSSKAFEWGAAPHHEKYTLKFSLPREQKECSVFLCPEVRDVGICKQKISMYLKEWNSLV